MRFGEEVQALPRRLRAAAAGAAVSALALCASLPGGEPIAASAEAGAQARALSKHPRILLDQDTLAALRRQARAGSHAWKKLRARCDLHAKGRVEWPDGDDYPSRGADIGEGYQGDGYYPALLGLGLCYQVSHGSSPARAERYAEVGTEILRRMSAPKGPHKVPPLRDSGYGIRYFGSGLAIGYDWFHEELSASERTRIEEAINRWVRAFERDGFERDFPQGNYFAGYYAAKAYAGLALDGRRGRRLWRDWLNRVHLGMVQPYYERNLSGGGWPEGWNYGPQGVVNMSLPVLAVRTAKGIDLINRPGAPYVFPLANPRFLIHNSWPNGTTMDDANILFGGDDPSALQSWFTTIEAGVLRAFDDPLAPAFTTFAENVAATTPPNALGPDWDQWSDFLFGADDPGAGLATLPLSDFAAGSETVAMRSSFGANGVWAAFHAGPYTSFPDGAHQYYDQGSIAIVNGAKPFLVNATGALTRDSPGTDDGDSYFDEIERSLFRDGAKRELFNIFYVSKPSATGQGDHLRREGNEAHVHLFEEGGFYVFGRGVNLEDNYPANDGEPNSIASWTRDVVYLRPGRFVIDDRTTITDPAVDQWMAFHFGAKPVGAASPPGTRRFDLGTGGDYRGSAQFVLPGAAATRTVNVFNSGKVFRIEVRPPAPGAAQRWLTVLDAAGSPAEAAAASAISTAAGNVVAGNPIGVLLAGGGANEVVLGGGGPAGTTLAGEVSYEVPAVATTHVVRDLTPGASFSVGAAGAGTQTITIKPGGPLKASPAGVLAFRTTAAGVVTAA